MIIEDLSLGYLGNQLLPLSTSQLMGDNSEFDVSYIFVVENSIRMLKIHYWLPLVTNY